MKNTNGIEINVVMKGYETIKAQLEELIILAERLKQSLPEQLEIGE
jgi:hypothetical protein